MTEQEKEDYLLSVREERRKTIERLSTPGLGQFP
jgi:hypothetical protein